MRSKTRPILVTVAATDPICSRSPPGELEGMLSIMRARLRRPAPAFGVDLVERVRHRLAQLGRGRREIAITHAALADEVGGSRANVSRALARLERAGVLHRRRGVIALR